MRFPRRRPEGARRGTPKLRRCCPGRCWVPPHSASFFNVTAAARREAVAHLKTVMGLSERRACQIISLIGRWCAIGLADRRRSNCERDCESSPTRRRRFGYRRLFVLLRREKSRPGSTRLSAVPQGSAFVRKRKPDGVPSARVRRSSSKAKTNARWSLDFVHDQFGLRKEVPVCSTSSMT